MVTKKATSKQSTPSAKVTQKAYQDALGWFVETSDGKTTTITSYDQKGDKYPIAVSVMDKNNRQISYTAYDSATGKMQSRTETSYEKNGNMTVKNFDSKNQLKTIQKHENPKNGPGIIKTYNASGKLISTKKYDDSLIASATEPTDRALAENTASSARSALAQVSQNITQQEGSEVIRQNYSREA